MKGSRIATCIALLLAASVPSLCLAQGPHPSTRQGWLVGFGVGAGSAGLTANGTSGDRAGGMAGSFRAGYVLRPEFSLELNSNGWTKEENNETVSFTVTSAAINYFPGNMGLVLRGGIGVGNADASFPSGNTRISVSESGLGFTFGAGYEFRVLRTFAIGPEIAYTWMTMDSFDANYINGALGFNWYFLPGQ